MNGKDLSLSNAYSMPNPHRLRNKKAKEKVINQISQQEEPGIWDTIKTYAKGAYDGVMEWDRQQTARVVNAWSNSDVGALARGDFKTFWEIEKNSSAAELVKGNFKEAAKKLGEENKNLSTALGFETAKDGYREVYKEVEKAVDDGDDTKLSKAEKAVAVVGGIGEAADDIATPLGLASLPVFNGLIKGGNWVLGKLPSFVGKTVSTGLVADGSRRVGNGVYDIAVADTKEEVKEGTDKVIGGTIEAGIGVNIGKNVVANQTLKAGTIETSPTEQEICQKMLEARKNITKDFPSYVEGRSAEETLYKYKELYMPQNEIIRKNIATQLGQDYETIFEDTGKEIPWLDSLVGKSEIPADTVLYRGGSPRDFGIMQMTSDEFLNLFYKKGRYFRMPVYPETSLNKGIGTTFCGNPTGTPKGKRIMFRINVPKGTNGLYMEDLGGKTFDTFCGSEKEVILPRDSIFKFGDRTIGPDYDIIDLDIVGRKPLLRRVHDFQTEIK